MADEFLDEIAELYKTKDYAKIVELWGRDGSNSHEFKQAIYQNYQPKANDLIISTYPKSGTTWTMQMAYQIGYLGEGDFEHIDRVVSWPDKLVPLETPEVDDVSHLADSPTGLHVIKGHLETKYVPYTPEAKYISVVRDPKDMLVSLVHFENGFNKLLFDEIVPPQVWIDTFQTDNFIYQPWAMFIDGWWSRSEQYDNVLILIYEEMKADPVGTVQKIADFVGISLTPEQFDKVVEKSSFAYMKANNQKFDPPAWESGHVPLIRDGKTGSAKTLLTKEQQASVDAFCIRELERLGSTFPYQQKFKVVTL